MVDLQKLGHLTGVGVGSLRGEDRIAEPLVTPRRDLFEQGLVVQVGGLVDAQAARRESGNGALAFCLDQGLGQGVERQKVEEAIEAVQGEEEGLPGLGREGEGGDIGVVEDVLGSPDRSASVADVAQEAGPESKAPTISALVPLPRSRN